MVLQLQEQKKKSEEHSSKVESQQKAIADVLLTVSKDLQQLSHRQDHLEEEIKHISETVQEETSNKSARSRKRKLPAV